MKYTKEDIQNMDRVERLKIINSVTGIKPANLIGTINEKGITNLAIFSSVVHLGSNPPLLGMISRPQTADVGHTYQNIQKNRCYTINHVDSSFIKQAHYTSAKFGPEDSEFDRCGFTSEYIDGFDAPFVSECKFKIGLKFREALDIKLNGTVMIIGEIVHLTVPDEIMVDGEIDLEANNGVGISGLNTYYKLQKVESHPYARIEEIPEF